MSPKYPIITAKPPVELPIIAKASFSRLMGKDLQLPVTDGLWNAIIAKDWRDALYRVTHCPWDASYRLKKKKGSHGTLCKGATCLHACCFLRAPEEVTRAVLEAFRPALTMTDTEGWTPLHLQLIYGSSQDTTIMLIREGGPKAAQIQAKYVGSPFHLACRHQHSMAILRELLQQDSQQIKELTVDETPPGRYPGDLIWHMNCRGKTNLPPDSDALERIYLCLAAMRGDWEVDRHTLHEILVYQHSYCTDQRVAYLCEYLKRNPFSARRWSQDGELPLHVAAAQSTSNTVESSFETNATIIALLLQSFPDAAKIPDLRSGRLPLHHALATGRLWDQGINDLVQANAEAIDTIDQKTSLFPFALAAAKGVSSEKEKLQLETIWRLLSANPSVLPAN